MDESVFGIMFVTMKKGIDALRGYSLDKESFVNNTSKPESVAWKKSNLVCYHAVHESVALDTYLVRCITSSENVADLMEKSFVGKGKSAWSVIFFVM